MYLAGIPVKDRRLGSGEPINETTAILAAHLYILSFNSSPIRSYIDALDAIVTSRDTVSTSFLIQSHHSRYISQRHRLGHLERRTRPGIQRPVVPNQDHYLSN